MSLILVCKIHTMLEPPCRKGAVSGHIPFYPKRLSDTWLHGYRITFMSNFLTNDIIIIDDGYPL